jgi:hypothetical protein
LGAGRWGAGVGVPDGRRRVFDDIVLIEFVDVFLCGADLVTEAELDSVLTSEREMDWNTDGSDLAT